mmetsp:Transcript_1185/g.2852  ORF Transcript_1185/g.2852 Transcript_1185/m.2852 type:complete len:306 (-) Transcript_1185:196-1113(-)
MSIKSFHAGLTWKNLAWGFSDSGLDTTTGEDVVLLDLDESTATKTAYKDAGVTVLCYFSVGTIETWRDDTSSNQAAWLAVAVGELAGWDEYWVDITSDSTKTLMKTRFEKAASTGCDGVELDNVDCYNDSACWTHISGITTQAQAKAAQITYNEWQTTLAHSLNLAVGLKNAPELISTMIDDYDFAINESCLEYEECADWKLFFEANKTVFNAEYIWSQAACESTTDPDVSSNTYWLSSKYCEGGGEGLCTSGDTWQSCFVNLKSSNYTNFDPSTVPHPSPAPLSSVPSLLLPLFMIIFMIFMRR